MLAVPTRHRVALSLFVASAFVVASSQVRAQVHGDASLQAGVMQRVQVDGPTGGPGAHPGPAVQLTGHVALLPLVRMGAYVGQEISPLAGDLAARDFTWAGLRAKVMSPWPRSPNRAWLFLGFGPSWVYARSTRHVDGSLSHGASGHSFELPFGLGWSHTLRKPFSLVAELGMRAVLGESGAAYEPARESADAANRVSRGVDRFAVGLTVGVAADL